MHKQIQDAAHLLMRAKRPTHTVFIIVETAKIVKKEKLSGGKQKKIPV